MGRRFRRKGERVAMFDPWLDPISDPRPSGSAAGESKGSALFFDEIHRSSVRGVLSRGAKPAGSHDMGSCLA